jgi:membrane fusion protein, multidrug efflux system
VAAPNVLPQLKAGTPLKCSPTTAPTSKCRNRPGGSDDSQIDATTGTVKVGAQFDNALFPNQFVNAQLLVKTLHNVVTVPTAAIQRGAPGSYVYVIGPTCQYRLDRWPNGSGQFRRVGR